MVIDEKSLRFQDRPSLLPRLDRLVTRFEENTSLQKALPLIALVIGAAWATYFAAQLGVQEGGDTPGYVAAADRLRKDGLTARNLFGGSTGEMLYHMTNFWLFLLGQRGLVIFAATVTAFLPYFLVSIMRRGGVKTLFAACALFYVAINPEIYTWAFYVLSDGLFLAQIMLFLFLLTTPRYAWYTRILMAVSWYSLVFTRSTSFLLVPATVLFALIVKDPPRRNFILGLMAATLVFVGATALRQRSEARRLGVPQYSIVRNVLDLTRRDFIKGHLLMDDKMTEKLSAPFKEEEAVGKSLKTLCWDYKSYCLHYSVRKYLAYIFPVYPKYSLRHKLFNSLFFGSSILLSIGGLIALLRALRVKGRTSLTPALRSGLAAYVTSGALILTASVFHASAQIDPDARYLMVWVPPWVCFNFLQANLAFHVWKHPPARG